ncbi:hypothetical protein PVV74_22585 [Roseovarius sp. SK2]|uniref:hypothetical protein n=1 Tax=Roseovarius TaxID=74030 RepID=UPI00237C3C23|nr:MULTISPECIES: hypothetical protein [unclassified Roseovarius]MDD9728239.1 hypothetical protein [Roseovarius sp. SK2]
MKTLQVSRMVGAVLAQNDLREATDVVIASLIMLVFKSPVAPITIGMMTAAL